MPAKLARVHAYVQQLPSPPPPTSPSLRDGMPHVFVFPPEEEQVVNPPWCFFNASEHPDYDDEYDDQHDEEHPSDAQYIDVALDFLHDYEDNSEGTPVFRRGSIDDPREEVVLPRKGEKRSSSVLSFISYRNDGEGRQHGARELPEDIVEVVKVRRNEGKVDTSTAIQNSAMKKSKIMKFPFKKAFKSIKNVGKSRNTHPKEEGWSTIHSTSTTIPKQEEIQPPRAPSRASSPLLTRRASNRISQLFTRNNNSNVDLTSIPLSEREHTPEHEPAPVLKRVPSLVIPAAQSSSLPYLRSTPSVDDISFVTPPQTPGHSPQLERTISLSRLPSTSQRSSKRFSIIDLHRVFTFTASPSIPGEDRDQDTEASSRPSHDTVPSLPPLVISNDATSTTPSSPSSSYHPVINISPLEHQLDNNTNANGESNAQWRSPGVQWHRLSDDPAGVPNDISMEMRLDSLHFDSLSFDPDDFDVSMTLDGKRRS